MKGYGGSNGSDGCRKSSAKSAPGNYTGGNTGRPIMDKGKMKKRSKKR